MHAEDGRTDRWTDRQTDRQATDRQTAVGRTCCGVDLEHTKVGVGHKQSPIGSESDS